MTIISPRLTPAYQVALSALETGISVLPIRPDGTKRPAVLGWKEYQFRHPTVEEVEKWFRHPHRGLALVTGQVSGGLIALDFDDPRICELWLASVHRNPGLRALYMFVATGYEEKTPKGGRHILFRCPEAFTGPSLLRDQKLALRPVPPPQSIETIAEYRAGGLIITDPSRGPVHPNGKPYVRLRGSVSSIRTISATECEQLFASVRAFDEVPDEPPKREALRVFQSRPGPRVPRKGSFPEERPGDLFLADPAVTWETLLADWDLSEPRPNSDGYLERFLRHPGKTGPNASCTLNADGTDRLYCFSPSVGLPVGRYFDRFEFYVYWWWRGDFVAAARALVEQGYIPHKASKA